LTPGMDES